MKNTFLIITLSFLTILTCFGQDKVIESSAKKTPTWLGASGSDFLTANAQGITIEQAKTAAFDNIKRQIIEAVALNITATSSQLLSQTSGQGGEISSFNQQFTDAFKTQAAKLPFVQGISPNKAADFYWEKSQNKKSKAITYGYSIKYPFTKGELHKLTNEFNRIDSEMVAKLTAIEAIADTFTATEQLDNALTTIPVLLNYFFDDTRIARTKAAQNLINTQYSHIIPTLAHTENSKAICILTVGNRTISTNTKPTIKSNCATAIDYKIIDNQIVITYDNTGCLDDEDNFLEIAYRFGGKVVKNKIHFDVNAGKFFATPEGTATIATTNTTDSTTNFKISFTLNARGANAVLESAAISSPLSTTPINFENQNIEISGDGPRQITLQTTINKELRVRNSSNELPFIKGTLFVRNAQSGSLIDIPINLKYAQ